MTKSRKLLWTALSAVLLCAVALSAVTSLAWLSGGNQIEPLIDSSVITQYFESGRGTADDPFIIHTPRHMYNFAWLQYMGQFNEPDPDAPGTLKQYYFELCDGTNDYASGHGDEGIDGGVLDMSGWTLPPVGTPKYPFIGHFEGNGITIADLSVSGNYGDLTNVADEEADFVQHAYAGGNSGCDIVGLFGVVGYMGIDTDSDGDGLPDEECGVTVNGNSYTYSSAVNSVSNVYIEDITVTTNTGSALAGLAAGYVNGTMSGVGVVSGTVVTSGSAAALSGGPSENVSDYTLVGYCEDEYKSTQTVVTVESDEPKVEIARRSAQEDGNAWGGSIDMMSMHGRLSDVYRAAYAQRNTTRYYVTSEIYDIDETNGGAKTLRSSTLAEASTSVNGHTYSYYVSDWGSYNLISTGNNTGSSTDPQYLFVYGENRFQTKTVTTYTHKGDIPAVLISAGEHYLSCDGSGLTDETTAASASRWAYDGDSHLYTIIDGTKYYLNYNGVGASGNTVWTFDDGDGTLTGRYNNTDYYAVYDGGWSIVPTLGYYRISDGSGHYLNANASGVLLSTAESSKWYFSGSEASPGNIFTLIEGAKYYLNFSADDGLVIGGSALTSWSRSGDRVYCTVGGTNYYLGYDAAWKAVSTLGFKIADGTDYLSIVGGAIGRTDEAGATVWVFGDSGNRAGTLCDPDSGRYVYINDSGNLAVTTDAATARTRQWTNDDGRLYRTVNNRKYYLDYDNGWGTLAEAIDYYTIGYNDNGTHYYLNRNGNSVERGTNANTATKWVFSDPGNYPSDSPSGTIRVYGTDNVYLGQNNNALAITNTGTTWTNSDNRLYYRSGSRYYYIRYYRSAWSMGNARNNYNSATTLDIQPYYTRGPQLGFTSSEGAIQPPEVSVVTESEDAVDSADTTMENVEKETETGVYSGIPTYFPINGESAAPFMPNRANTGYIVSGTRSTFTSQEYCGDIRVSWYAMSNLSASLNQNSYDSSRLQVLTQVSDSGLVRIDDEFNNVNSNLSTEMRGISSVQTVEQLDLQKYESARRQMEDVFEADNEHIYGLHFMDALIDKNYLVTADNVIINDEELDNYELPQDSIDFTLPERGFINFFAGTYFVQFADHHNNSFFSLHEISRNDNDKRLIDDIKEIDVIYGDEDDPSAPYIYEYTAASGGGYSGGYDELPDGYTMKFRMDWVKSPQIIEKALYYYEIPVNEGEYALGSVEGGDGAYLIYLDISANAQILQRQDVTETVYRESVTCEHPVGVALSGSFTADTDSAAYRVSGGGTVTLERSGSAATVGGSAEGEAVFIGYGLSVTSGGNALDAVPLTYERETVRRLSRYDYNTATHENTKKVILTTVTDTDGIQTRTYTVNGESSDGDDGADIVRGTLGLKYHYILPDGVAAADTIELSGVTETGYAGVTQEQYLGMELTDDPVDVTGQMLPIAYGVTTDVTGGSITVNEDVISADHTATINGRTFTAGTTIDLPLRSRSLSIKKGGMSADLPKTAQPVPDVTALPAETKSAEKTEAKEIRYAWEAFSDRSLETWIRDPSAYDAIAAILTSGGDECDAIWERIESIEDEEIYLTVCARLDDIFARLERTDDKEDEAAELFMMTDREFCDTVTDPMMRETLMDMLSDAESEEYAELYRRALLIVSDRLFFKAYDHLKRLEQADGRYAWSYMTDEEFAEWLMYGAEPAGQAELLWYPESEDGAALKERIYSVRDRELRELCSERAEQLLGEYPPPVIYEWSEMTDEEFAEWVCGGEAAEYIMYLLSEPNGDETAALTEKAALMEAGEAADRVAARIEELRGELVRRLPWVFMKDEELVVWITEEENSGFIAQLLALTESDEAAMLTDRTHSIENDELRIMALEKLGAIAASSENTEEPSDDPTEEPTGKEEPSGDQTEEPTGEEEPSGDPTGEPGGEEEPSGDPTGEPDGEEEPSGDPTGEPDGKEEPSDDPTGEPDGEKKKTGQGSPEDTEGGAEPGAEPPEPATDGQGEETGL